MFQKNSLGDQLLMGARVVLYGLIFSFPLFLLPFTLDYLEVNKQSLLLVSTLTASLLFIASALASKRLILRFDWLNIFPLLVVVTFGLSAFYSLAPYVSWIGSMGSEYTSVLTIAGGVMLFYLLLNISIEKKILQTILLSSASIAGLVGIVSIFGAKIIPSLINTVGTFNALAIFLITISVFGAAQWMTSKGSKISSFLILFLHAETIFLLIALDYSTLWILMVVSYLLLFVFVLFRSKEFPSSTRFFLPVAMVVTALLFWFGLQSPLQVKLPIEVTLNFASSAEITKSTFETNSPLFGTGPGTYAIDYSASHGAAINKTDFWNTRFDRAVSFFLTLAPTVGYLGVIVFFLFLFVISFKSLGYFLRPERFISALHKKGDWSQVFSLFVPWASISIAAFLFPFNTTLIILVFLFSGLLAREVCLSEKNISFASSKAVALVCSFLFFVLTFLLFVGIFLTTERYIAEAAFAKAVRADRQNASATQIVTWLDRAVTLNRYQDDYVRVLSQALLFRVEEEMKTVGSSKASAEMQTYIQSLVAASVNAAVRATDLSPYNVTNWLSRAMVYRELMTVLPNASIFSIEAYKKATNLEPNNPSHFTELGKTQMAVAEQMRILTVASDKAIAEKAKGDLEKFLDDAESSFNKAISLKSNYDPVHFQLALLYEREGKLNEAIGKLESVAGYNQTDVGVAFELGQLYLKRDHVEDLDRAANAFRHAIKLTPSYSNAHWYLASIYEKQNKRDLAIAEVQIVLDLNPGNKLVKARLDKLKAGGVSTVVGSLIE